MKYKLSALIIYELGGITNRNREVTNLEIGHYQNEMPGSKIYVFTILDSYFGYGYLQNRRRNRWYL